MKPTPILFVGDSPDRETGLARIARSLAVLLSRSPRFRVGYLGLGGTGSRKLPFPTYVMQFDTTTGEGRWGEASLPWVWQDFAGRERGVIFTIWDITRLAWLSRPDYLPDSKLRSFLLDGHFDLWGYFPVDATGPGDRLSVRSCDALMGYHRRLAYTKWGAGVIERSTGQACEWMPHGSNLKTFVIHDREEARGKLAWPSLHEGDFLVGVVASNQARKDWGLVAAMSAELKARIPNLRLWWHVDVDTRYWNIPALVVDYGLDRHVIVTHHMDDATLALAYSACNVTVHPGSGEGWCLPITESLACGTPVVHGSYGGGAQQVPEEDWLIHPIAWRVEGPHNCLRPVYDPKEWADRVTHFTNGALSMKPEACRASVAHLGWGALFPTWLKWFEKGLR